MTPIRRLRVAPRFSSLSLAIGLAAACFGPGCGSEASEPPPAVVVLTETADMDPDVLTLVGEHVQRAEAALADFALRGDLGLAYEANNMFPEAERCYAQAAAMAPDEQESAKWNYKVSLMMRRNGDLPGALALMKEVAEEFTSTNFIHVRLGDMYVESNDMEGAEIAYRRAVELEEKSPFSAARLANLLRETDRAEEAIVILETLVGEVPTYKHAHFRLGQAYQAVGRSEEAKRELQLGADAPAGYPPDAYDQELMRKAAGYGQRMGRIENMLMTGNFDEALAELASILEDRPEDTMVLNLTARAHAAKGDPVTALAWLEKSLEFDNAAYRTHMLFAELAFMAQEPERALKHADRAVELSPGQGLAHFRRGWVLFYTGDLDEALEALCTAEDKGCQDNGLYFLLAQAYGQKEMFEPAVRYAKLAVEKMPQFFEGQLTLARACLSAGDVQTAHTAFLAAEALAPADPGVLELKNIFSEPAPQ
ncbi:MAG: tetratricopeptide (TPR) repeat protein [Chlamydiales bacterium]|jgi:tetratricopeptide (TPR) repeat protein